MLPILWLALASAEPPADLADWSKAEGELPEIGTQPEILCCGYAPHLWRQMLQSVRDDLAACAPKELERDLRVTTVVIVPRDGGEVTVSVDAGYPDLSACMEAALAKARWPGEPPSCEIRLVYPVVFAAPGPRRQESRQHRDAAPRSSSHHRLR